MRRLLAILGFLLAGCAAHGAVCTTLSASPSQATIQSALNSCGNGNYVQLSAGTTSINTASPLNIPCGVMLIGPTATPATAILNGGNGIAPEVTLNGACSSTNNTGASYIDFDHGGGFLVDSNSHTNVTFTHNQFTNIPDATTSNTTTTTYAGIFNMGQGNVINGFTFEYNSVSDANSCTNTIDRAYVSSGSDGSGGPDGCGIEIFGQGSVPYFGVMINAVVKYNTFYHLDEGIHFYGSNYQPPASAMNQINYANGFDIEYNYFYFVRRITIEWQAQTVFNPLTISNNVFTTPGNGNFNTYYISTPCCQGGTYSASINNNAANPAFIEQNNVGIAEGPASTCTVMTGCLGAIWWNEYAGNNSQANYNLVQGVFGTGYEIGYAGFSGNQPYVQYNSLEGPWMAGQQAINISVGGQASGPGVYMAQEFSGNPGFTCCNTPNNLTATLSTVTSATPGISPASGNYTFPLTVTLTDAGLTSGDQPRGNTGIWYTTDGSTPVPGSGTAQRLDNGGTFSLASPATVKAVGMFGSANQPTSYPTGYGFVPSSAVSATYMTSGGSPTLTSCSQTNSGSVNTLTVGGATVQQVGKCTYSSVPTTTTCSPGNDTYGNTITAWGSTNTAIISVSASGIVTAVGPGTASVTATATGGLACSAYGFTVYNSTTTTNVVVSGAKLQGVTIQ